MRCGNFDLICRRSISGLFWNQTSAAEPLVSTDLHVKIKTSVHLWNHSWCSFRKVKAEWFRFLACFFSLLLWRQSTLRHRRHHALKRTRRWMKRKEKLHRFFVPVETFPPRAAVRGPILYCVYNGVFFCLVFGLRFRFSFYGCRRRPPAPSCGTSVCCRNGPTGRRSPGPETGGERKGGFGETERMNGVSHIYNIHLFTTVNVSSTTPPNECKRYPLT